MGQFFTNIFDMCSIGDFLEKGREAQIGEIREWKGVTYKKVRKGGDGWVRVIGNKEVQTNETSKNRQHGKVQEQGGMVRGTVSGDSGNNKGRGVGSAVQRNVPEKGGLGSKHTTSGGLVVDVESSVAKFDEEVSKALTEKGIRFNPVKVKVASAKEFHSAISAVKEQNENGWMVDVHEESEYENDILMMLEDGSGGIAVEPSGNITSVFATGRNNSLNKLMMMAIAMGGDRLDCFYMKDHVSLPDIYSRFGFKVASTTPFQEEIAPDGFKEWKEKEESDLGSGKVIVGVAAMYLDRESVQDSIDSYSVESFADFRSGREFKQKEVGYDRMLEFRNNLIKRNKQGDLQKSLVFTSIAHNTVLNSFKELSYGKENN